MPCDRLGSPWLGTSNQAALGPKHIFRAAVRHRRANQLFTSVVSGRGIEKVNASVERGIQKIIDLAFRSGRKPSDLKQAQPDPADLQSVLPRLR